MIVLPVSYHLFFTGMNTSCSKLPAVKVKSALPASKMGQNPVTTAALCWTSLLWSNTNVTWTEVLASPRRLIVPVLFKYITFDPVTGSNGMFGPVWVKVVTLVGLAIPGM